MLPLDFIVANSPDIEVQRFSLINLIAEFRLSLVVEVKLLPFILGQLPSHVSFTMTALVLDCVNRVLGLAISLNLECRTVATPWAKVWSTNCQSHVGVIVGKR